MNSPSDARPRPTIAENPLVEVRRALPEHAASNWAIYYAGRTAAQPNESIGLTRSHIEACFRDPTIEFFGKRATDWLRMINDDSGDQTVLNAFTNGHDKPVAIARPNIQDGERWLNNVYVSARARRSGVARALIEATREFHDHEPFKLMVASYNEPAIHTYRRLGLEFTGLTTGYYIFDIYVPQTEMIHPGG